MSKNIYFLLVFLLVWIAFAAFWFVFSTLSASNANAETIMIGWPLGLGNINPIDGFKIYKQDTETGEFETMVVGKRAYHKFEIKAETPHILKVYAYGSAGDMEIIS
jgi:hypothetical protein